MNKTTTLQITLRDSKFSPEDFQEADSIELQLPGKHVLKNIMDYSRSTHIQKSKTIEQVEVILN
jgi:hypothetical protein